MNAASVGTSVLLLAASDVRPTVGEAVRLSAAWDGPSAAAIPWEGVDSATGAEATVTPRATGPLTVRAGDATIVLNVQPAENSGASQVRAEVRSLPEIEARSCRDDRYPALAGAWVAWCSATGRVDRAWDIVSGATVSLSDAVDAPGLGPAAILADTRGLWRLPDATPVPNLPRVSGAPLGPPATDGVHGAFVWATRVESFALAESLRAQAEAAPLPWYAAALAWPWAAWVEDGGTTREDIWARREDARRVPLARTARDERHPVGSDRWLGWVDSAGVYVQDMTLGERRAYPADTGFLHGPSLWGPVACWEDRGALRGGTGDIDILCSDGLTLRRPGNQRAPTRWGPWLIFREADRTLLATASELILDDDDPRAEGAGTTRAGGWRGAHRDGAVTFTFDWPAAGWGFERWEGGAWVPGGPLAVGRVTLTHPGGDAVRLAPVRP